MSWLGLMASFNYRMYSVMMLASSLCYTEKIGVLLYGQVWSKQLLLIEVSPKVGILYL